MKKPTKKIYEGSKVDRAQDKRTGVKEGSKKDMAMDAAGQAKLDAAARRKRLAGKSL